MKDLIDRQEAIDAVLSVIPYDEYWKEQIEEAVGNLPSAQPETNCSEISNNSDLISRQAAIDALHTWFRDGFEEDRWWNSTHVLAAIEGLPSVQQERKWESCFECPLSQGCPKIKGCTNEQAIEYASQIPNDCPLSAQPERKTGWDAISRPAAIEEVCNMMRECFEADDEILDALKTTLNELTAIYPERKTGRWIKPTGMMPPEHHGHYECSECGAWAMRPWLRPWKGVVLTDFCPNCGSPMLKDGENIDS